MGGQNPNAPMLDKLLSTVGSVVGQIPIAGDVAGMDRDMLTGTGGKDLPPTEQLGRALMTAVVGGNSPGSIPGMLAAYQTSDAATAIARKQRLSDDAFQDSITTAEGKTPLEKFYNAASVHPELNGYNPMLHEDGTIALPPRLSEVQRQQLQVAQASAPPGATFSGATLQEGKTPIMKYEPFTAPKGEFSANSITEEMLAQRRRGEGDLVKTRTEITPMGKVDWFRWEPTLKGEVAQAGAVAASEVTEKARAELITPMGIPPMLPGEGPTPGAPGAPLPPGATTPPAIGAPLSGMSPAAARAKLKGDATVSQAQKLASAKGLRAAEATAAEIGGLTTRMIELTNKLPAFEQTSDVVKAIGQTAWATLLKNAPKSWAPATHVRAYYAWLRGPAATKMSKLAGEVRPTDIDVERVVEASVQVDDPMDIRADKIRHLPDMIINTLEEARAKYKADFGVEPRGEYDPVAIRAGIERQLKRNEAGTTAPQSAEDRVRAAFGKPHAKP